MRRTATITTAIALALMASSASPAAQRHGWVAAWSAAQVRPDADQARQIEQAGPVTLRQIVRLRASGPRLRLRLSNLFGATPLRIDAAAVARAAAPGSPQLAGEAQVLRFNGEPFVTIPPGAEVYSDAAPLPVGAGTDLAIDMLLAATPAEQTGHPGSRATAFLLAGNAVGAATLPAAKPIAGWHQIADVEVDGQGAAIVAIGDSITDGYGVRPDSNARWTDVLAERLQGDARTRALAVANAGIGGNRVLLEGIGPNLVARFDRDVIARSGVRYAMVLEGVNDLGVLTRDAPATADAHRRIVADLTGAFRQLAERAHAHGITLIGGTITPFVGNSYYHPGAASEANRQAVNRFIRTSGVFDAVVDFDRLLRDPAHPERLAPALDSGDHLHPSEAGYRTMGEAVPLSLFGGRREARVAQRPAPLLAITFDDMPAHGPLPVGETRLGIAQRIIAALKAHGVTAPFGFLNGGFGVDDPQSPAVLRTWRAAGYPIGNHTWSHLNLDTVTAPVYLGEVARNEPVLARVMGARDWRWFRYPFLSEGSGPAKRKAVRAGLRARGYRVAAVTMSFGDYAWNDAYARCKAKGDGVTIAGLERSYLAAAETQAQRSRTLAQATLGRDIPYVLLMHLGAFDARMMPRLLDLYGRLGFRFTSLPEAEADPFYAAARDLSLPGPSPTLEAAANAKGVPVPPSAPLPGADICA